MAADSKTVEQTTDSVSARSSLAPFSSNGEKGAKLGRSSRDEGDPSSLHQPATLSSVLPRDREIPSQATAPWMTWRVSTEARWIWRSSSSVGGGEG